MAHAARVRSVLAGIAPDRNQTHASRVRHNTLRTKLGEPVGASPRIFPGNHQVRGLTPTGSPRIVNHLAAVHCHTETKRDASCTVLRVPSVTTPSPQ